MTKAEQILRHKNSEVFLNACVGFERYKKIFDSIPYTIIDIGAHIGGLTLKAMEQGVSYILAIEADGQNYEDLVENVRRQTERIGYEGHVECLHRAFCDTNDDIVEIIAPQEGKNNSVQRSMFYSKSAKNIHKDYTIKFVKTINIDGIIEKLESIGAYAIDLFKCDIEGAEFIAMPMKNRTREFFSHIKYIDIELHPWTNSNYYDIDKFYQLHPEFDKDKRVVLQYFEFLRDCGFCIPDEMLQTEHDYLKLTTYNKLLCSELVEAGIS
jgi:FkbM family methyltransferase